MTKPNHVLAFVVDGKGQLSIHADLQGLDALMDALEVVRRKVRAGECEHEHLMTDAWGGSELSEKKGPDAGDLIHHVKVYGWTDDWTKKHDLTK